MLSLSLERYPERRTEMNISDEIKALVAKDGFVIHDLPEFPIEGHPRKLGVLRLESGKTGLLVCAGDSRTHCDKCDTEIYTESLWPTSLYIVDIGCFSGFKGVSIDEVRSRVIKSKRYMGAVAKEHSLRSILATRPWPWEKQIPVRERKIWAKLVHRFSDEDRY